MESLVLKAEAIARKAHYGQRRKLGKRDPFIVHPQRIVEKVASLPGMTEVDIAAAWLHDVLEDCGDKWEPIILEEVGQEVLDLVKELTFPTEGPGWKHKSREEKNVIRFGHMEEMSSRARRIKLVDRWDNIRDLKLAPKSFQHKYRNETVKLLELIGDADVQMKHEVEEALKELNRD